MSFAVTSDGQAEGEPEPKVNADDMRRAALLAKGGGFGRDAEDLFAEGIAVARSGGDVTAFLRERLQKPRA